MTYGEIALWKELKGDKLLGFDFDRQRCIDNYIVDFYCKELMLLVEIDGMSHNNEEAFVKDETRQKKLESFGIKVIRFSEAEIKNDMLNVLRSIETEVIDIIKSKSDVILLKDFDMSLLGE